MTLANPIDVGELAVGDGDLLFVLRPQVVLRPSLGELEIGVDEQHLAPPLDRLRPLGPQNQDRGRNSGAAEEVRTESYDGVAQIVLDDAALFTALEQHTVGHDRGDHAAGREHADHVLKEHQVGLLAPSGV